MTMVNISEPQVLLFFSLLPMIRISRCGVLEPFISESVSVGGCCRLKINMLNYSEDVNGTSTSVGNKSMVRTELLSVLYVVGIMGSFLALLHLYQKQNWKNTKQAFMLK